MPTPKKPKAPTDRQVQKLKDEIIEAAEVWLKEVHNYTDINLLRLDNAVQAYQSYRMVFLAAIAAERKGKR